MTEADRRRNLEILRETPGRLKAALSGVPIRLARWRPAPGKWSILEIVCHMRDMERDAYLDRYRRILGESEPRLPDRDGDVYALERGYRSQALRPVLRDWLRLRREVSRLLRTVKGDAWNRVGHHELAGPLTVEALCHRHAAGNDQAHLGQIQAIKERWAILSSLESGPRALAEVVKGLSDEAVRQPGARGQWSILEIACHLRDVELHFAERFSKIAHSERPRLWKMDNNRVAAQRGYRDDDLRSVLQDFRQLRGETLILLRALPHPGWQRTGLHPDRGEVSIEALARTLVRHDDSHLNRARALRP